MLYISIFKRRWPEKMQWEIVVPNISNESKATRLAIHLVSPKGVWHWRADFGSFPRSPPRLMFVFNLGVINLSRKMMDDLVTRSPVKTFLFACSPSCSGQICVKTSSLRHRQKLNNTRIPRLPPKEPRRQMSENQLGKNGFMKRILEWIVQEEKS